MRSALETRIRHVTAVLGPTNTGKTHLAIERMLGHESGMIGLPLRLLAREVYDKIGKRIGFSKVALITGEEKIKPERARYWVATVEAMPQNVDVDFLAIDEVQLAADPERGHVFTHRLLNARGQSETLLLGAQTMRETIQDLIPGANFISRPRLSNLTYAGQKKITRLPSRSAVVAFSAAEVYAIAELIRRQRGGAAVVLGALSPRTRNAQVALYQSGDVDFLVATDAIGMGLNLDVDHVAFSAMRKFDGQKNRELTPAELSQIAGRAGRHMNDGTFGVTGTAEPFDAELIERLESHTFDSVRILQWRNRDLDFATLERLRESLREAPQERRLTRARNAVDVDALEAACRDSDVAAAATTPAAVSKLWDVCQLPDYRKISSQNHAELVTTVYKYLVNGSARIPDDWFAKQVAFADRTDGDIDTLANRLAHIRTWTFVSNRADWLADPVHWQGRAREIEDKLSDALHERLTQRFVDRRTSALMKGMREKDELSAEIGDDGSVEVENHFVGRLTGFRFTPDTRSDGYNGKATRHAAAQVLSRELSMRARRVAAAKSDAFKLTRQARIHWRDEEIARIESSDDPLKPAIEVLSDEHLSVPDRDKIQAKLEGWICETIAERLKPLVQMKAAEDISGLARGIAFRLIEGFGLLKRDEVADEIKTLDQPSRAQLRKYGVRFGAFNIYCPLLLKPAAAELLATLWSLGHAGANALNMDALPEAPRAGLTSAVADADTPEVFYRANGYHLCGPRVVRIDILERLADQIRPLMAWRAKEGSQEAGPVGATGDGGFKATPEMMSILGCSPDELGSVLKVLGFRLDRRPIKKTEADATNTTVDGVTDGKTESAADVSVAAPEKSDSNAAGAGAVASTDKSHTDSAQSESVDTANSVLEVAETAEAIDAAKVEGQTVEAAGDKPCAADTKVVNETEAEAEFEEIWRPRRRRAGGEGARTGSRRRRNETRRTDRSGGAASQDTPSSGDGKSSAPAASGERETSKSREKPNRFKSRGDDKGRRDGGRRGKPGTAKNRHKERRGQASVHSSSPRKSVGADPDSPFAALGALKDALDKGGSDKGS